MYSEKNYILHTPGGVKDWLADDCTSKYIITQKMIDVYKNFGYKIVESPTFEYLDLFSSAWLKEGEKELIKFFDVNGEALALRADMTPPISRIAATAYNNEDVPLRFSYSGNVFRYNENYMGKLRETTQSGIELIGINTIDADAEVIAIAINSLLSCGLEKFRIDIGEVRFIKGILEEAGLDKSLSKNIQNMLVKKDYIGIEETLYGIDVESSLKEILENIHLLVGGLEILEDLKNRTKNEMALNSLERLKNIYDIIDDIGLSDYVSFDLGLINHTHYYTGIIFRGNTYGTGFSIVDGGRYDNLASIFGRDLPSVGFTVKINNLIDALARQKILPETIEKGTLLVYSDIARKQALSISNYLRLNGLIVENSLIGSDISKNINYAKSKKISGIIYFEDEDNIQLINIETGNVKKTTSTQLYNDGVI